MIIGQGMHRYEVIDLWGSNLPEGLQYGTTHGITEDLQGRIIVFNTGTKSVIVLDPDGNYLDSWGEEYSPGAHGILFNREADGDYFYLATHTQGFVAKTTSEGKEIFRIGTPELSEIYDGKEKRFEPTATAVASSGDIYIADGYGQPWIHQYSPKGEYIRSFGGPGSGPGQLKNPHGLTIETRSGKEYLLVADRHNVRLQYFTLQGEFVKFVNHSMRHPCTIIQWRKELYVPDLFSRITIFDGSDQLIMHLGDRPGCWEKEGWPDLPKSDWIVGQFSSPHDLHVDNAGNIYVAEWMMNGIGKLTKLVRL